MAEAKKVMTHEQDLGPGVVRTPGYEAVEGSPPISGYSDRRIDKDGVPADHPILSTYDGPQHPGVAGKAAPAAAAPAVDLAKSK